MNYKQITKVKLHDDGRLDAEYLETLGIPDDDTAPDAVTRKGQHPAHPDLVNAINDLRIHMATICEQDQYTALEDDPSKLDIYKVTGVTLAGDEPEHGIVIVGSRQLKGSKTLNLVSPFTKLNDDKTDYRYAGSLQLAIQTLLTEVAEYLNGKFAPSNQLNMFDQLDEAIDQEEGEAEEERPNKRKKREAKTVKLSKDHPLAAGLGDGVEVSVSVGR